MENERPCAVLKEKVRKDDSAAVNSAWKRNPLAKLLRTKFKKLLHLDKRLVARVIE